MNISLISYLYLLSSILIAWFLRSKCENFLPEQKWLKDRKGRKLTDAEIRHQEQMLFAMGETIRIMDKIDKVIEAHGGWPGAFQGGVDG